jgi:hypothetical protein
MRRIGAVLICLWPALAFGQQAYTNADLVNIQVPGAYTNEDLKKLPPLAMQRAPAAPGPQLWAPPVGSEWQPVYNRLRTARVLLQAEIDYEIEQVDFSESAFAGDPQAFAPRLGYRTGARPLILELKKRAYLLDKQIEAMADTARQAGDPVDPR